MSKTYQLRASKMTERETEENMDGGDRQDIEAKSFNEGILLDRNEWR